VCQKPSQIEGHISANYEGWKGHHWEHPYGAARNLLQQEVGFHKEASGCVCVCVWWGGVKMVTDWRLICRNSHRFNKLYQTPVMR
jgi:hypothetical protein